MGFCKSLLRSYAIPGLWAESDLRGTQIRVAHNFTTDSCSVLKLFSPWFCTIWKPNNCVVLMRAYLLRISFKNDDHTGTIMRKFREHVRLFFVPVSVTERTCPPHRSPPNPSVATRRCPVCLTNPWPGLSRQQGMYCMQGYRRGPSQDFWGHRGGRKKEKLGHTL